MKPDATVPQLIEQMNPATGGTYTWHRAEQIHGLSFSASAEPDEFN